MMVIDTGPLVAFFDASDDYHETCLDVLKQVEDPLMTTWSVITEAFYLLDFSLKAQDNLWEFIKRGGLEIIHIDQGGILRCRELMKKYQDLPMDLADATLVVLAEHKRISRAFTLDHKDFRIYEPAHVKALELLPAQL